MSKKLVLMFSVLSFLALVSAAAVIAEPKGWFDSAGCSNFEGWACNPDHSDSSYSIGFYEGSTLVASGIANSAREAAVGAECGGNSNHGFVIPVPASLKDGHAHSITAKVFPFGTRDPSASTPIHTLEGNPKSLTCAAPTRPGPPLRPSANISVNNQRSLTINAGTAVNLYAMAADPMNTVNKIGVYVSPYAVESWSTVGECSFSGSSSPYVDCTKSWTPTSAGKYYVVVNAYNSGGLQCTGNPFRIPSGWSDCGIGDGTLEGAYDGTHDGVVVTVNALPAYDAQFVSQSVPATMCAGQRSSVSVTMKNTGSNTWTRNENYKLGSQNPQDNTLWGVGRVELAAGESVATNQQKTFSWEVTAPSTAGTYNFQWKMLRELVTWFGSSSTNVPVNAVVNVASCTTSQAPAELKPTAITYPTTITAGDSVFFDSGIANNGGTGTGTFNIKWFVDGVQVGYGSHSGIGAGQTVLNGNSQYTWTAVSGKHAIKFTVDADNHVAESNENNNDVSVTVAARAKVASCVSEGASCGGIANVACCSGLACSLDSSNPDAGGTCVNQTGTTRTCTDSDGSENFLQKGTCKDSKGTYTDFCTVEPYGEVNDYYCFQSSKSSYCTTISTYCQQKYGEGYVCRAGACVGETATAFDLAITDLTLSPEKPSKGESLEITFIVKNVGVYPTNFTGYGVSEEWYNASRGGSGGGGLSKWTVLWPGDSIKKSFKHSFSNSGKVKLKVTLSSDADFNSGNDYITKEVLVSEAATCTDSDGGINYYVKGITRIGDNTEFNEDFCGNNVRLAEFYCNDQGGTSQDEYYDCPNGCKDGACVKNTTQTYCNGGSYDSECYCNDDEEKVCESSVQTAGAASGEGMPVLPQSDIESYCTCFANEPEGVQYDVYMPKGWSIVSPVVFLSDISETNCAPDDFTLFSYFPFEKKYGQYVFKSEPVIYAEEAGSGKRKVSSARQLITGKATEDFREPENKKELWQNVRVVGKTAADDELLDKYANPTESGYLISTLVNGWWAYSKNSWCSISGRMSSEFKDPGLVSLINSYNIKLVKGWNFLMVSPDMVDHSVDEFKGTCSVSRVYMLDTNQKWYSMEGLAFGSAPVGYGMIIKVDDDCVLGFEQASPPPLPLATITNAMARSAANDDVASI